MSRIGYFHVICRIITMKSEGNKMQLQTICQDADRALNEIRQVDEPLYYELLFAREKIADRRVV